MNELELLSWGMYFLGIATGMLIGYQIWKQD